MEPAQAQFPVPPTQQPPVVSGPLPPPASALGQIPAEPNLDTHIIGKRVVAAIVDLILVFILLSLTDQGGFILFKFTSSGYSVHTGPVVTLSGLKGLITVLVISLYFVLFEALKGGTIGKLAAGIKVVMEDGSKIGLKEAVIRNISRSIDGLPYIIPYLLGMIVMTVSKKRQRIGDKLAKTLVVKK